MLDHRRSLRVSLCAIPALLLAAGCPALYAQVTAQATVEATARTTTVESGASVTEHAECSYFTEAQRQKAMRMVGVRSRLTEQVTAMRRATQSDSSRSTTGLTTASVTPNGGNSSGSQDVEKMGTIDRNIFQALAQAGVAPAPPTTDQEFYRRVT